MKILILGASGMLGNTLFRYLSANSNFDVTGTLRSSRAIPSHAKQPRDKILLGIDALQHDSLVRAFAVTHPDVVINCVGVVKQLASADDPLTAIPINSVLPHQVASLADAAGARVIHFSTDCVYSGKKGQYVEADTPDAVDLYGRSKYLGELSYAHTLTLRTSIIGHELEGNRSLLCWFLSQRTTVNGYANVYFSGLPTVEIAKIIENILVREIALSGVYNVASHRISKLDLLRLVSKEYQHAVDIRPADEPALDRSLDASRFYRATAYTPAPWPELLRQMHSFG